MTVAPPSVLGALTAVMQTQTVTTVAMPDAAQAAGEVIAAVQARPDIAIVQVKSSWASKINWAQVAGPAASTLAVLLSFFGLNLTPEQILGVVFAIQTIQSVATWIIRTWFTSSVTAASMVPPLTKE